METKIKDYWQKLGPYLERFRDIRAVGLMLFLVIVLLISWSGVKIIETNYGLQRQISQLEQQKQVQELSNNNLKLQNQYFDTAEYQELAARRNFGLAAPGETVWAVPKAVALAHTVALPDEEKTTAKAVQSRPPVYQRNFQAWMNFLFHREQTPQTP